ncbi:MAG TPA: DUF3795 domain-containing protein [Candidatus Cloacimonadota bacterium]|jgi:hypothetical protein|nr:DUF3795 domain-containing protein [Candidatus Cloacimonadota bacterium]HOG30790.1 DUF3795 domain-containing protein [Candidatus Cloacimonadota bacterium]HOR59360.1 DUF3795 domain-containing protein [Candidatus Cloacimonadota bacterium]HPB09369.1 DUF3795 domain-containing protein [Candidatus Cloacimonadota bacterium]HPL23108.1 DUF3795 domain-containing protein [Candidatus Cloacimonadota bacterium]
MSPGLAPCGFDCTRCPVFTATQNDDSAALARLAADCPSQPGKEGESVRCGGCLGGGDLFHFCSVCAIRACALERNLQACAECADFPCPKGKQIWGGKPPDNKNVL